MKAIAVLLFVILLTLASLTVSAQEPEATPDPEQKNDLGYGWEMPITFSVYNASGERLWGHTFNPVVYGGEITLEDIRDRRFQPGQHTGVVTIEDWGNPFLIVHSGIFGGAPLEGEEFRHEFESGLWPERAMTDNELEANYERIRENTAEFVSQNHTMRIREEGSQSNPAVDLRFDVAAIAYIDPSGVPAYSANTRNILGLAQAFDPENTEVWQEAMDSPDQYVIMAFCGWGPYTPDTRNSWYIWARYIVLLRPQSPVGAPT